MRPLSLLLGSLLALSSCASQPTPTTGTLNPVGLVEIAFDSLGGTTPQAHVTPLPLTGQTLTQRTPGLQLESQSVTVFNTGTRGVDGVRYISATFRVRNADQTGTPSPTSRQNLTLLAVSAGDTLAGSPFRAATTFVGTPVPDSIIQSIKPTHAMRYDPLQARAVLASGAEDLQIYTEDEVAENRIVSAATNQTLSYSQLGVNTIFPYGYVIHTTAGSRTLPANPATNQFDGQVTFSMRMPLQPDDNAQTPPSGSARDPWAFRMVLLIVDDSDTRVTQSLEEQALGNTLAAQRATTLGGTVNIMPGSNYPSGVTTPPSSRCIDKVRTSGLAGAADATYLVNGGCL